ncbi:DUF4190 domain-containing protein [Streptomyces sp. NBC_00726]|uniref:DUF4190 domain-containing protein n=1 Tax=Streptomyces sp. NBC_00726 TaxID=2903674 RepID=UPI0038637850
MPLDKKPGAGTPGPDAPHTPAGGTPADGIPGDGISGAPRPPAVHDQQTVTSMPGIGTGPVPPTGFGTPQTGPAGWAAPGTPGSPGTPGTPGSVPPPPVGPNGPGQAGPPPQDGFPGTQPQEGYPGTPPQYGYPGPQAPGYGYPGAQPPQFGYPAGQAPQYGYQGYPGYGNPWGGPGPANGMGIAALVLGIIATAGFCMYGLGIVLGVLALIFGIIGRGRAQRGEADNGGVALAGIILGSIGIVISAAFLGFFIWLVTNDEFDNEDSGSDYEPAPVSLVAEARGLPPLGHFSVRA